MMNFEEFVKSVYPDVKEQYEFYCLMKLNPEELIGKKVIATRSGFSCESGGGTIMTLSFIGEKQCKLLPNELSPQGDRASLGWGCDTDKLPFSVKLYKE